MNGAEAQHHPTEVSLQALQPSITSTHGQSRQTTLKALLEAGVHFGHQAKRWNPKMRPFIFAERNGIHIIDLQQTVKLLEEAHGFIADLTARGGKVLFVGTKKQAQDVVRREAERSGQFYINRRWLGGTLTNFVTIRNRLRYLKQLQAQAERGELDALPKQESAAKLQELERLERTLGGLRDMTQLPGAVFIIDPKREHLAILESRRLGIPVVAVTDTNCDPDDVDFIIPGNDDAIRSVRLLAAGIADAAREGLMRLEISQAERAMDIGRGNGARRDHEAFEPVYSPDIDPVTALDDDPVEAIADAVIADADAEAVAAAQRPPS